MSYSPHHQPLTYLKGRIRKQETKTFIMDGPTVHALLALPPRLERKSHQKEAPFILKVAGTPHPWGWVCKSLSKGLDEAQTATKRKPPSTPPCASCVPNAPVCVEGFMERNERTMAHTHVMQKHEAAWFCHPNRQMGFRCRRWPLRRPLARMVSHGSPSVWAGGEEPPHGTQCLTSVR